MFSSFFLSLLPVDAWRKGWSHKKVHVITSKILAFNRLARYLCKSHNIYHVHLLKEFLNQDGDSVNQNLFRDYIHTNHNGTTLLRRQLLVHLNKPSPLTGIRQNRCNSSYMLPNTLPLDNTPSLASAVEESKLHCTPLPGSDVSSDIEIAEPIASSSPPPTHATSHKSLTESLLEKIGIGSILAPDQKTIFS